MKRKSPSSVKVDYNIRSNRVYPTEDSNKEMSKLKTVGLSLNKNQALQLARILLLVTQEWDNVDITCYRFKKRKSDGTYQITITTSA